MSQEVLILGLNPAWQRLFYVDKFTPGEVHRIERVEEYYEISKERIAKYNKD